MKKVLLGLLIGLVVCLCTFAVLYKTNVISFGNKDNKGNEKVNDESNEKDVELVYNYNVNFLVHMIPEKINNSYDWNNNWNTLLKYIEPKNVLEYDGVKTETDGKKIISKDMTTNQEYCSGSFENGTIKEIYPKYIVTSDKNVYKYSCDYNTKKITFTNLNINNVENVYEFKRMEFTKYVEYYNYCFETPAGIIDEYGNNIKDYFEYNDYGFNRNNEFVYYDNNLKLHVLKNEKDEKIIVKEVYNASVLEPLDYKNMRFIISNDDNLYVLNDNTLSEYGKIIDIQRTKTEDNKIKVIIKLENNEVTITSQGINAIYTAYEQTILNVE